MTATAGRSKLSTLMQQPPLSTHSTAPLLGRLLHFPRIRDPRGNLTVAQGLEHVPFAIKRTYWVYDVPGGECRGGHAHLHCQSVVVAVSGAFHVNLTDGHHSETILLNHPWEGLLIPTGVWRTLDDFSSGAVCLVLASDDFDEQDYIRSYEEFLAYKKRESR